MPKNTLPAPVGVNTGVTDNRRSKVEDQGTTSTSGAAESTTQEQDAQVTSEARYTDQDVDKYKGLARKEGGQAAINKALARAEGAVSIDDLIAAWEEKRTVEEATKSDLAKLEEERDKYKTQAEAAAALANDRLIGAELRTALGTAGVPSDRLADALALADKSSLEVDKAGNVSGLEDAVKGLLEPRPWLTGEAPQQTYRAADTTQAPANQGDPQAAMGSFLNQVLNGP